MSVPLLCTLILSFSFNFSAGTYEHRPEWIYPGSSLQVASRTFHCRPWLFHCHHDEQCCHFLKCSRHYYCSFLAGLGPSKTTTTTPRSQELIPSTAPSEISSATVSSTTETSPSPGNFISTNLLTVTSTSVNSVPSTTPSGAIIPPPTTTLVSVPTSPLTSTEVPPSTISDLTNLVEASGTTPDVTTVGPTDSEVQSEDAAITTSTPEESTTEEPDFSSTPLSIAEEDSPTSDAPSEHETTVSVDEETTPSGSDSSTTPNSLEFETSTSS